MAEAIHVLLVDDADNFRGGLEATLRSAGFSVTAAASAIEARDAARTLPMQVAVIDQVLPGVDGIETMRQLQAEFPDLVAIILTAWGVSDAGLRALQSGAYRYISKREFNVEELMLLIQVAVRHNREARQRKVLQLTLEISRALQSAATSQDLVKQILAGIQKLAYDRARIYLFNKERTHLLGWDQVGGTKVAFGSVKLARDEPYTADLLRANAPCIFIKGQHPDHFQHDLDKEDLDEWAEFPLQWEGLTIGKLTVDNKVNRRPLTQQDLDDLTPFAAQAAAAITRMQRIQGDTETLSKLAEAGRAIAAATTEEELYDLILTQLGKLLPKVDAVLVTRYDARNQVVALPFWSVRGRRKKAPPRQRRHGLTEYVLETQQPLLLADGDAKFRRTHGLEPAAPDVGCGTSLITVPTYLQGKLFGTMSVMMDDAGSPYSQKDCDLLQTLASYVVVAVQNVRQLEEGRQLREASAALAAARGMAAVKAAIVDEAHRIIGADATGLILVQPDGTLTRVQPYKPPDYFAMFPDPRPDGVTRYVVETRRPLAITDAAAEPAAPGLPRVKPEMIRQGIRSTLALPLIFGGSVLGVLSAHMKELRAFPEWEIDLWSAFANQAAAALHTAMDEEKATERLNRQLRAVTDILRTQHKKHDVTAVLDEIARAAVGILGVGACTVHEYNVTTKEWMTRGTAGLLQPAASWEGRAEFTDFLEAQRPTVIKDAANDERLLGSRFVLSEQIRSCVVCSLRSGEAKLGLLFANYRTERLPSRAEITSIQLFGELAAMELYEARLRANVEEKEARLDRSRFLRLVAMLNDTVLHSMGQLAASIMLRAGMLERRLAAVPAQLPAGAAEDITEIRNVARQIRETRPRVPQAGQDDAEPVSVAELITATARRQERRLEERRETWVQVSADVAGLGDSAVLGYRAWLVDAFDALLHNARTAVVTSGRASGRISMQGLRTNGWAEIRISDTGTGLPPAIRTLLFKEIIPHEEGRPGMGIGALLAATIIEEHAGTIGVTSTGKRGTTILIRLPLVGMHEETRDETNGLRSGA